MNEKEAYVAFNLTDGVGSVGVSKLISQYGSAVAAWENYPSKLGRLDGYIDYANEFKLADKFGVTILTPVDEDYPILLKETRGHPLVLYVKGNVKALSKPSIAMVGTRRATDYGKSAARDISFSLANNGWSIISGLALGIDAAAHTGALEAGGITVGVLGSALDKFFPEENRELARQIVNNGGAVISEFPFGRVADEHTFPQRNRIVAALCRGIVAIEAPFKSGTLITTKIAADLGRTVMALPGRVDSRTSAGCLSLIREGARLVRNARDIEEEMGDFFGRNAVNTQKTTVQNNVSESFELPPFDVEESLIMRHLSEQPISLDTLIVKTKLSPAKVNTLTMGLRLKGRIRFFPGNRVALPKAE